MASRFPFEEDRRWRFGLFGDPVNRYIYIGKDACAGQREQTQVPDMINRKSGECVNASPDYVHDRREQSAGEYDEFGALNARTVDFRRN